MNKLKYLHYQLIGKLTRRGNSYIVNKLRKEGIQIGEGSHVFSNIITSEPYLISIGKNCTISTEVCFITHDASIGVFKNRFVSSDICGKIEIGDNCFIGNRAILLYGVKIPNNTIVAAGSVVCNSFKEEGYIVGGNPAKIIGKISDFLKKNEANLLSLHSLTFDERKAAILKSKKFVKR